jgi:hypothetical protein
MSSNKLPSLMPKRIAQSYKVNNSVATVLSYTRRHCGEQSSNCMPNTVATS